MNNISVYSLNISDKFDNEVVTRKELKNIYQMLKRYKEASTLYKDISFMIGISNKDSSDAKVVYSYNNLRGKPRKKVIGTDKDWHFHIYIIGNDISSASSFCNLMRIRISKKKGYKTSQTKNTNIDNAINYVYKQCISVWVCGDYFDSKN